MPASTTFIDNSLALVLTDADITLTVAQAKCQMIMVTGTITQTRTINFPEIGCWLVWVGDLLGLGNATYLKAAHNGHSTVIQNPCTVFITSSRVVVK